MPKLSVVIGVYNQKKIIQQVLEGFNQQTELDFELCLVDSGSTDGSIQLYDSFSATFDFRYVIQENKGKAAARNTGIKQSKSDIILITDADMVPDQKLVASHLKAHQRYTGCFQGLAYDLEALVVPPQIKKPQLGRLYKPYQKLGWYFFLTGNLSIPKSFFNTVGLFDEDFTGYGWEDLELGYRFYKKNILLRFLPTAINYHYHILESDKDHERQIQKGLSAQLLVKKHPELKTFVGDHVLSRTLFSMIKTDGAIYTLLKKYSVNGKNQFLKKITEFLIKEHYYWQGLFKKIP